MRPLWRLHRLFTNPGLSQRVPRCCLSSRFYCRLPTPRLRTMKLDSQEFEQIFTPELNALTALFKQHSFELRLAGGAVRDLLMGKQPHDFDFATTATPQQMKDMFETEGIRMINMRGEKHGTITCRINDKENFEITTLRIDVVTDGRHAEVKFTKDWELDALRRDLTINAMFLSFDGIVHDYFNGREDLKERTVRFVGTASARIQEDYLRILRYFRFFGRIAREGCTHDKDTLSAIEDNMEGLQDISGERIWVELRQILAGPQVASLVEVMLSLGMGSYIGLPSQTNMKEFVDVQQKCQGVEPKPLTLLAALLETEDQVHQLHARLKLSRDELNLGLFIVAHRRDDAFTAAAAAGTPDARLLHHCKDWVCDASQGAPRARRDPRARDHVAELLKYGGRQATLDAFRAWQLPRFPVSGNALLERGVEKGPALAAVLGGLRAKWKESEYTLDERQLLAYVDEVRAALAK